MADELPPLIQQLVGDAGDLFRTLDQVEARLRDFAGKDYIAHIGVDAAATEATIKVVKDALDAIDNTTATPTIDGNDDKLLNAIARAQIALLALSKEVVSIPIEGNDNPFLATLAELRSIIEGGAGELDLKGVSGVMSAILQVRGELAALKTDAVLAGAGVNDVILTIDDLMSKDAIAAAAAQTNLASLDATIANLKADTLQATLAMDAMNGGGGGGGGGGGMAGWAANALIVIHAIHLFMPEILGLAAALGSAAIGFGALGVAAAPTVSAIQQGYTAVNNAQDAIAAAIPGTTQWTSGVQALGRAWSQIPTALQPAVSALQNFMSNVSGSSLGQEVQSWVVGVVDRLTTMFSGIGSTFTPLILATQRAVDTMIGIIGKLVGSQGFKSVIDTIAGMVGPATIEIGQLIAAIAKIGLGFAQAVKDGQGMEALIAFFRTIADIVNSSFFQGLIAGWVEFDRIVTDILAGASRLIGFLSQAGVGMHSVGVAIGFVVSGLAGLTALSAVSGWLSGIFGTAGAASAALTGLASSMKSVLASMIGPAALVVGVVGLSAEISKLTGIANPIGSVFHGIASALGFVTDAAKPAADSVSGFTGSLNGAIYGTQQLSAAQDLLVRSEQSIGGSLGGLANGFTQFTTQLVTNAMQIAGGFTQMVQKATDSVSQLLQFLQGKNQSLAQWAADAQLLIKRGMDPSAVASLAQQAPQDLASMATATSQQLEMMNIQWQEQMLLATLSGQKGIKGFTDALKNGITNGTPTVAAAATALATQIGQTVGIPFTGSLTSIQQIGNALNTLPVSVLEALAGKTHQVAAANTDAANKATAATATIKQSWETVAVGLAANVALIAFGLSKTIGMVSGLATKLFGAAAAEDAVTASAIPMDAALDANPIGAIVLAAAALGVGLYELVKHFDAVSKFLNGPWGTAISAAVAVINPFIGITMLIIGHWRGVVNFFTHDIPEAINAFVGFFVAIPGRIDHIWGDVVNGLHSAWSDVANWVHGNITGPIAAFFEAIPGTIGHIWGDVVSAIHGAWSSVANWVSSTVIQPIVNAYNTITRLTSHIWSDVVSAIHGAWTAIAGWVDTVVIHPIVSFFNSIVSAIDHVWSDVVNAIHTAWSDIAHWVSTNIIDPIKKLFNDIPGAIKAALAGLAAIIEAPFAAAAGAISTIVGGIISVVHGIASAVSAATGAVSNFFAGGSGAPANPTHLTPTQLGGAQGTTPKAMGGPVSVATPYLVGEQGPEIFVPHADGTIIPNHAIQGRAAGGLVDQGSPYLIGENGAEVFIAASFGGDLNTNALTGGVGNDALSSILVSVIQSLTNAMSAVVGRLAANATTLSTLTTTIQTDITTVQADITAVNALTTALNANATAMASAAAASTTTAATVDAGTAAAAVSSAPTMADYAAVASQFPVTTDAYSMGLPNSVGSLSTTAGNLGGLGQGVVNIVPNLGPNPTGGITGGYVSPLPPAAAGDTLRQIGFQNSINPVSANYGGLGLNGTTVLHVTSPINIDGRTFASIMTQYQLKGARATGNIAGQWSGGTQNQTATRINVNAVAR